MNDPPDGKRIRLLGATQPLLWEMTEAGLAVSLPSIEPGAIGFVLEVK